MLFALAILREAVGCADDPGHQAASDGDGGGGGRSDAAATATGGIRGRIIDEYGLPVDAAKVIVAGESTLTKYDGTFVVGGEPSRYDLIVATWDGAVVVEVVGLTRRDPVVQLPAGRRDHYQISLSGRLPPIAAGRWAGVAYSMLGFPTVNAMTVAAEGPATTYSATIDRWVTDGAPAKFWLFELADDAPYFRGYASRTVTLGRAALEVGVDFGPMTRVTSGMIHGALEVPDDFVDGPAFYLAAFVRPPESTEWLEVSWKNLRKANPTGSCPVPVIEGAAYAAAFTTIGPLGTFQAWKTLPLEGILKATFARAGEVASVGGGHFGWRGGPGGAHVFSFESAGAGSVYVLTESASATFPDLSALGIKRPANTSYGWSVSSFPDLRTTDAMTDPNALPDINPWPQIARGLEGGTYVSGAGGRATLYDVAP